MAYETAEQSACGGGGQATVGSVLVWASGWGCHPGALVAQAISSTLTGRPSIQGHGARARLASSVSSRARKAAASATNEAA